MLDKFDKNKKNLLISVGLSFLVVFFDLEIQKISFFENVKIPNELEIYFILVINLYLYSEVFTSYLLIELKKELDKRVYNFHFLLSSIAFFSITVITVYKNIDVDLVKSYLKFTVISLLFISIFYLLVINVIKFIISIKIIFSEVVFNFIVLIFNLLFLYVLILELKSMNFLLLNKLHYSILFLIFIITTYNFPYLIYEVNFFKNYKEVLLYNRDFMRFSNLQKFIQTDKLSNKEIQHLIKNWNIVDKRKGLSIEENITRSINSGDVKKVKQFFFENPKIDINYVRYNGWTYLFDSVSQGELEITKFLLENGIEVNVQNRMGYFPLTLAINYNNIEVLKLLLEYHADVNLRDSNGYTPIFGAIDKNNMDMLKILIDYGANYKKIKVNGLTPVKFAQKRRYGKMIKYLKDQIKRS